MITKLCQQSFWPCSENGLIQTIQTIPHILYASFKLSFLLLWVTWVIPDLQRPDMKRTQVVGVPLELSWCSWFHGRDTAFTDWVLHSPQIGELWPRFSLLFREHGNWMVVKLFQWSQFSSMRNCCTHTFIITREYIYAIFWLLFSCLFYFFFFR